MMTWESLWKYTSPNQNEVEISRTDDGTIWLEMADSREHPCYGMGLELSEEEMRKLFVTLKYILTGGR